jgi:hypothetical protein
MCILYNIYIIDTWGYRFLGKPPFPPIIKIAIMLGQGEARHLVHMSHQCKPPQTITKYNIVQIRKSILLTKYFSQL